MSKKKILIVDDTDSVRMLLKTILVKAGYEIDEAGNGLLALRKVEADPQIALILLDIMMPVMDGFVFLEKIKKLKAERNFKICFTTAKSATRDVKQGMRLGIDDYIVKPVDRAVVLNKISRLLDDEIEDVNFCSTKADLKVSLVGCPVPIELKITEFSESAIRLESNMKLQDSSYFQIESHSLSQILKSSEPLNCIVASCTKNGRSYNIAATLSALTDELAENIRSYTTKRKEVTDEEFAVHR